MMRLLQILLLIGLAAFVVSAIDHGRRPGPHDDSRRSFEGHRREGRSRDRDHDRSRSPRPPQPPRPVHIHDHDDEGDGEDSNAATASKVRSIAGRVSATEERAREDAYRALEAAVVEWLAPQAPASWKPPARLVDPMILETRITPEEKPYGTVYTATLDADFQDARKRELVKDYRRVVSRDRSLKLGALFGFLLVCLGAVSGFIRADEATKGYYTTRLRLVAAAAVGASGVVLYHLLV